MSNMIRGMGSERLCSRCDMCGRMAEYPCSKRQVVSVAFKVANLKLLQAAVAGLEWTMRVSGTTATVTTHDYHSIAVDLSTGRATVGELAIERLKQLKQSYSMETAKTIAKQNGFTFTAKAIGNKIIGTMGRW